MKNIDVLKTVHCQRRVYDDLTCVRDVTCTTKEFDCIILKEIFLPFKRFKDCSRVHKRGGVFCGEGGGEGWCGAHLTSVVRWRKWAAEGGRDIYPKIQDTLSTEAEAFNASNLIKIILID